MKAIEFPQQTAVIAKDQPQYSPLPVYIDSGEEKMVISCYKLTLLERLKLLFTGKLWFSQFTFGQSLQPQRPDINSPFVK